MKPLKNINKLMIAEYLNTQFLSRYLIIINNIILIQLQLIFYFFRCKFNIFSIKE